MSDECSKCCQDAEPGSRLCGDCQFTDEEREEWKKNKPIPIPIPIDPFAALIAPSCDSLITELSAKAIADFDKAKDDYAKACRTLAECGKAREHLDKTLAASIKAADAPGAGVPWSAASHEAQMTRAAYVNAVAEFFEATNTAHLYNPEGKRYGSDMRKE